MPESPGTTPDRPRPTRRVARAALLAIVVAGALLTACGGGDDGDDQESDPSGAERVVYGATELGTPLEVTVPADPAADPLLADLEAFRAAVDAPPVFYAHVVADNTEGEVDDTARTVVLAEDPDSFVEGGAIQMRFTCDALDFEWIPAPDDAELLETHADLQRRLCRNGPPQEGGLTAGEVQEYYLFVEEGLQTQAIGELGVYGPRGTEFTSERP